MNRPFRFRCGGTLCISALVLVAWSVSPAAPGARPGVVPLDALLKPSPSEGLDVATEAVDALPAESPVKAGWDAFRAAHGGDWQIYLDRRSGAPLLVQGPGIPWSVDGGVNVDTLGASLVEFARTHRSLLLADPSEMTLNREGSAEIGDDVWQIVFDRVVSGIPVVDERYLFTVSHGRLAAFGASRWSRIVGEPRPTIEGAAARRILLDYMGITETPDLRLVSGPTLELIPTRADARAPGSGPFAGEMGTGYGSKLVWRVVLSLAGEPETWAGLIDARTGAVVALGDETRYARIKGGVYPHTNTNVCPGGCEAPGSAMPFADVRVNGVAQNTTSMGGFTCSGPTASTTLHGPYVAIIDECGALSETVSCNADIDLKSSAGTDCSVPSGSSAGNTHAARTTFYHVNRAAEHARSLLPTLAWPGQRVLAYVNLSGRQCSSFWSSLGLNFGASFNTDCGNTGEIAGIIDHEWGHGLDENDGGGVTSPSEGYADIASVLLTHDSCIGPGFGDEVCGGTPNDYCDTCTGYRDVDWAKRQAHAPSVPGTYFPAHSSCATPFGPYGPCGYYDECEAYFTGEAIWDLVTRDLPSAGVDPANAWALVDRWWFSTRVGAGGNEYNCALPSSDGCSPGSLFSRLRLADDDDGNFADGTPHAAEIFAAFNRHGIACGTASDGTNQDFRACPVLAAPTLQGSAGSTVVGLSWTPIPGVSNYRVLRNDLGCNYAMTRTAQIGAAFYNDVGLPNGVPLFYTVQAMAQTAACDGGVSNCVAVTPQSAIGTIKLDDALYGCGSRVFVTVVDGNAAADTVSVFMTSSVEATPETITLARTPPGSATYYGSIGLTSAPAAPDGALSVADGSTITARYTDADDGAGHFNQPRIKTGTTSCAPGGSLVRPVPDGSFGTAVTASRASPLNASITIRWDVTSCTSPGYHLLYGYLSSLATGTVSGALCGLGTSGTVTSYLPDDIWFVVVGDDNASTEGSWGTLTTGEQRGGASPSGQCGMTARDDSGTCP